MRLPRAMRPRTGANDHADVASPGAGSSDQPPAVVAPAVAAPTVTAPAVTAPAVVAMSPEGVLNPADLARLLGAGTRWLERNATAINALNVFPVPDGDTGTNMLLTMRAALAASETAALTKGAVSGGDEALRAIARGAVMGARGNSGVILSQIIAGMTRALEGADRIDGVHLAKALVAGAGTAYRAVTRPVEGTILTVARSAGDAAVAHAEANPGAGCEAVMAVAVNAARHAVEHTPEQLPILREAGVVDAGGEGYRVILEGVLYALRGQPLPEATEDAPATPLTLPGSDGRPDSDSLALTADEEWGYCTQFVIRGDTLDLEHIRQEILTMAASALVVGDEEFVRVHGHTEDPGQLLTYAVRFGRLQGISIEDMDAQHDEWLRAQASHVAANERDGRSPGRLAALDDQSEEDPPAGEHARASVATVAVSPGPGLTEVFESVGAARVIAGGQTMNPSAHEIVEAARRAAAATVVVLPNNGNVVMTAQQAATLLHEGEVPRLLVVPTRTVPQGIAAQLAFNPELGAAENVAAMTDAASRVRTVEVTRATRAVTIDGIQVRAGDTLGLLDDQLTTAGDDVVKVACQALDRAGAPGAELITVYRGANVPDTDAEAFADAIRQAFPQADVELVAGGQPHYDYIISVE